MQVHHPSHLHAAALASVHHFLHAVIALVGNIAPVGEHPVLRIHALCAILFIVIKCVEVFVIVEAARLLDHVLAVLLRRMRAGSEVKEVEVFRKVFDLCRGLWLCQHDYSAQLFHICF